MTHLLEQDGASSPSADAVAREPRRRRTSRVGEQFVYAGVEFELLTDFEGWELSEGHRRLLDDQRHGPVFAQARCSVSADPTLASERAVREPITWAWEQGRAQVRTGRGRAQLQALRPGLYASAARCTADTSGVSSLVTALASTILNGEGGLVLHASGIALGGRGVLFIGPSGAGKTTACNQAEGATCFARDRASIFPANGRWWVWGLAGGDYDTTTRPAAERSCYPLGAVLRVRHARDEPHVRALGAGEATATLRESVHSGGTSRDEERRRFDAIARLVAEAPVAEVHTRLGQSVTPLVQSVVEDHAS